jgi:hypothetical protein
MHARTELNMYSIIVRRTNTVTNSVMVDARTPAERTRDVAREVSRGRRIRISVGLVAWRNNSESKPVVVHVHEMTSERI